MLELKNVSFTHTGAETAVLKDLSLHIRPGEMVAVMGAQGSGISTLCRLAAGLLETEGHYAGTLTRTRPGRGSGAAMLGDDPEAQLTGMTGFTAEEVRLPSRLTGTDGHRAAQRAEAAMSTLGISTLAEQRLETLSGGERQLTALAGLLTLQSQLLVLDQPSLALDAHARRRLLSALTAHCAAGGSVLVGSHQHDEITEACHRAALLKSGRVRVPPSTEELSPELLASYGIWCPPSKPTPRAERGAEPAAAEPRAAVLEAQGLAVGLGDSDVLTGVDLRVEAGTITAVMGPNGAGKSTLLRALAGLTRRRASTASGEVRVQGRELTRASAAERAPFTAWVGQDAGPQLSAPTVRKELERALPRRRGGLGAAAKRGRLTRSIEEVLRATGLEDAADEHPYDLPLSRRKDLVIATALLLNPHVLLLDEPTLGRDHRAMEQLTRLVVEEASRGTAVVLTTHDQQWARSVADQLHHLSDGVLA